MFLLALYYVGMTPKSLWVTLEYKIYKYREKRDQYREAAAPDMEARQAQLDERREELARIRREQAERQRIEREMRSTERAIRRESQSSPTGDIVSRRRGAIDDNIYADDNAAVTGTAKVAGSSAAGSAATESAVVSPTPETPAPQRKSRRPRRDGTPVPGEVYDRGQMPDTATPDADGSAPIVTVNTETGEVLSEIPAPVPTPAPEVPDENAYSLAAQDESAAIRAGQTNDDTAARAEMPAAESSAANTSASAQTIPAEPKPRVYTPTGEIDLAAIFSSPKDETLLKKYGPSSPASAGNDLAQSAELELTVQKTTPVGCVGASSDDDTPPWETPDTGVPAAGTASGASAGTSALRTAEIHVPVKKPAATPDGMTEIPDIVSKEQIEEAIRASNGEILREHTGKEKKEIPIAAYPGRGDMPDPSEDPAALLASLNSMYAEKSPVPLAPVPEQEVVQYVYPPVTLLKKDTSQKSEDVAEELQSNAQKLTDILRSFNVKTKIVNVSRGPTITRYELQPEAGTRVRSVANLVDDIALGLAADGVRIEAPIPGKSAIGIEVPNRSVSTVYIRDLIESDAFLGAKSKLTTALGMDVAGAPIYLDAAKMPHLLICGATGMGKSVCINALIVSMLYKATPEEVKLILIDPKKVELNIYSGIPHLLVPVVSDPKKAAGALHWAVTEMERRFELIEDVGMRDIKGYNDITKNDPDREYLPQIVIIIDELADLMMTAPDEVEESICRLAQKARAAGMYLIIGTQRPSVDVITGLIKANIPSRIAFRVSSQMDSRVILDEVGAEKLIGRGDMLYKPVGAPKPKRVQGSFVSEDEIDAIITFLKKTAGHAEYADDVMASIEKEAAMCGQKKSSKALDGDDFDGDGTPDDPMLKNAVELAVESGKISTSLIQRRLSLGYGRAAKLIDRMEQLGYVSAPEGQKPRQVLITKEQYMELVLKQEEIG